MQAALTKAAARGSAIGYQAACGGRLAVELLWPMVAYLLACSILE